MSRGVVEVMDAESRGLVEEFIPRDPDLWVDAQVCRIDDNSLYLIVRPEHSSRTLRVMVTVQVAVEL